MRTRCGSCPADSPAEPSLLLPGPRGEVWVFDYKGAGGLKAGLAVTLTGSAPGWAKKSGTPSTSGRASGVPSGSPGNASTWPDGHFGVVDLDGTTTVEIDDRLRSPHPDQRGSMRLDDRTVLTASRHGTVYRIDVESGHHMRVAELDMLALGCDLAGGQGSSAYGLEHRGGPRAFIPIVVRLSGSTLTQA